MSGPLLVARGVSRRFGTLAAVDEVSMRVEAGEVVGLLGANGAGKTTLMRLLLGLLPVTEGAVQMLGGAPSRSRRRRIGYLPQNLGLYRDMTLRENLAFVGAAYGTGTPRLPDDLVDEADVLVGALPLGTQRRGAFVAALSHRPEAVLLDEPTSGVDALARARLWDTIREQSDQGVGVLVTTHYLQEAQQCDRLLLLSQGRLVAQGSERDIVGGTRAWAVRTRDWASAFSALDRAGLPVTLDGRSVRVAGSSVEAVRAALAGTPPDARVEPVPATIEERMLVLARGRS